MRIDLETHKSGIVSIDYQLLHKSESLTIDMHSIFGWKMCLIATCLS